jgi:hypothetical protein
MSLPSSSEGRAPGCAEPGKKSAHLFPVTPDAPTSRTQPNRMSIGREYAAVLMRRSGTQSRGTAHPDRLRARSGDKHASSVVDLSNAGASTCLEYLLSEMLKHAKSTDTNQRQRTELSQGASDLSQGSFGPITPRRSSPQLCAAMSEQPGAGSVVKSTRPPTFGPSCSPLRLIQTGSLRNSLCGND